MRGPTCSDTAERKETTRWTVGLALQKVFSERGWLRYWDILSLPGGPSADATLWVLKPEFALHLLLTLDKLVSIPEPFFLCL